MSQSALLDEAAPLPASRFDTVSEARLTWLRFRAHRLAMVGLVLTIAVYLIAIFAEPIAPFDPQRSNSRLVFFPPQSIHWIDHSQGGGVFRPYVLRSRPGRDPVTLAAKFVPDPRHRIYLGLFVSGAPYRMWGLIPSQIHLFGPINPRETVFLLGADRLGRDMLSRIIYGARTSLSIGIVGVSCSLILGILFGGMSGYFGGRVDWAIQRVIEFILSLPTIPIWLALAAALPKDWSPLAIYFTITLIISLIGWTELARVIRGRFLALRSETYVTAAWLDGASQKRIIFRHMLPALTSHIIAAVTLAIPMMILAETSLSFLGLGLQPPAISWGSLLEEAQSVSTIATAPWLLLPGAAVAIVILALNFLGDGLRDAADPHAH
jgi:peptide/nickel transport system permease protein